MKFSAFCLSDPGQTRSFNEDHVMIDEQNGLFMVADGMGGKGSETPVSQLVIKRVHTFIRRHRDVLDRYADDPSIHHRDQVEMMVSEAIREASEQIYGFSNKERAVHGSGTTLTLLCICGPKGFVAHVGDSRAYLVRSDEVHQLTDDHTLLYEYLKQGLITRDELRHSKQRKIVTRAVGLTEAVQVDFQHLEFAQGDKILLCTDGLHVYFEDTQELNQVFKVHALSEVPNHFVGLANSRGGADNIGAVAVSIEELEADDGFAPETSDIAFQLELLWVVPFFAELAYSELLALHSLFRPVQVQPGDVIIKEDSEGEEFYIVLVGEVSVSRHGTELDTLHRGAHFGEMSLLDKETRSATVVATQPTLMMMVDRASLFSLMRKERSLAVKILWSFTQTLTKRLRKADEEISLIRSEDSRLFNRLSLPPAIEEDKPYPKW